MSTSPVLDPNDAHTLLASGRLDVQGRITTASNATLFAHVELDGVSAAAVYKPVAGERPLWDFPDGTLAGREVASYLISRATGWDLVPLTLLREGPFGPGMCQLWVEVDPETNLVDVVPSSAIPEGWLRILDASDGSDEGDTGEDAHSGGTVSLVHADRAELRRMAVLDAVLNNADRKGGHVLVGTDGVVRGVDHGVCLHVEDKLRTVLWGWAGDPIEPEHDEALTRLVTDLAADGSGRLRRELEGLITGPEVDAVLARAARLLRRHRFPRPSGHWPAIPWPAF